MVIGFSVAMWLAITPGLLKSSPAMEDYYGAGVMLWVAAGVATFGFVAVGLAATLILVSLKD